MSFLSFLKSKVFFKHLVLAIAVATILILGTLIILNLYTRHGQALPVPDFRGLKIENAKELVKENKLRYEIIDSVYLVNKDPGTIIDQNPSPGFKVKKNRRILFTINAEQPKIIKMPNVKGVSFRQAKAILEMNGLKVGTLEYVKDIALNNVLKQKHQGDPIIEGSPVYKYSTIDLVLGSGVNKNYTYVPDLTGNKYENAREMIHEAYCNLGDVHFDNTVKNYADSLNAMVWKQIPEPTDESDQSLGTGVDIWMTLDTSKIILNEENTMTANDSIQ